MKLLWKILLSIMVLAMIYAMAIMILEKDWDNLVNMIGTISAVTALYNWAVGEDDESDGGE